MSFFAKPYLTPQWFTEKQSSQQARRTFLKSAAGATAFIAMGNNSYAGAQKLNAVKNTDPWLTLEHVLNHLLPSSNSGPGAKELNALNYLFNVVYQQPTSTDEKDFIIKGVSWLNDYSQSQIKLNFSDASAQQKETLLRAISRSSAGDNWINTLLGYLFEAMLAPPSYGGNPNGIGWQWLEHQPGFPLPQQGQRFYELPLNVNSTARLTANTNTEVNTKHFVQQRGELIMRQKQKGISS